MSLTKCAIVVDRWAPPVPAPSTSMIFPISLAVKFAVTEVSKFDPAPIVHPIFS